MKKLALLSILVPVPIVVGLVLDIVGTNTGNLQLAKVGIDIMSFGTPLVMLVVVVIGIVMFMRGSLSSDGNDGNKGGKELTSDNSTENPAEKMTADEEERRKIEDINSSYGYENYVKNTQYQLEHRAKNYREATRNEKIIGFLLLGFLVINFGLIFVFGYLDIIIGAIVCGSVFVGTILILILGTVVLHKISLSQNYNPEKYEEKLGTVCSCVISSTTSSGSRASERITSVVYKVKVDADGKVYTAYSRTAYDNGAVVVAAVKKNGGVLAKIITRN